MGVATASWASGSCLVRRWLSDHPAVRVLTYHRFGDAPRDPFCVSVADFDAQMRLLSEQGRAVSLEQIADMLAGRTSLPEGACLVSIDDGMVSTLEGALPVLQRWRVPAAVFVSSALIDRHVDGAEERYLTWTELTEVADSGLVDVGSHAHTHRSLGSMPPAEASEEMVRSRAVLEDRLARPVTSFAYPFGTRHDYSPQTDAALERAGYEIAFNSMHGAIRPGMSCFSLPRVKVEGGEPLFMFDLVTRGGMDAWRVIDSNLWRFQRVRTELQ